jgi:hypothetical protein
VATFVNGSELNEQVFRGPSKDASYQVSIYLAKWFQRRRFLEVNQSETRIYSEKNSGGILVKVGAFW